MKSLAAKLVRAALFGLAILTGLYTSFFSQASSADYHRLFWSNLPVAVVHFASVIAHFLCKRHWTRWIVLGIALVALVSFGEMTLRVWR